MAFRAQKMGRLGWTVALLCLLLGLLLAHWASAELYAPSFHEPILSPAECDKFIDHASRKGFLLDPEPVDGKPVAQGLTVFRSHNALEHQER